MENVYHAGCTVLECFCGEFYSSLHAFNFMNMDFADGVIAGGAAGVVVETALYPIDTIKTRLQAC